MNMWSMMNLLETSLRVPLIIKPATTTASPRRSGPGHGNNVRLYSHPVELLDLFPTLAALAHIPPPAADQHLGGVDLSDAMHSGVPPGGVSGGVAAAFSQITRCVNCTAAYTEVATYQRGCDKDSEDSAAFTVPCANALATSYDWMGLVRKYSSVFQAFPCFFHRYSHDIVTVQ